MKKKEIQQNLSKEERCAMSRANLEKARANKKPMTQATKDQISAKLTGRKLSDETKEKISKNRTGINKGVPMAEETKTKISASAKTYWASLK